MSKLKNKTHKQKRRKLKISIFLLAIFIVFGMTQKNQIIDVVTSLDFLNNEVIQISEAQDSSNHQPDQSRFEKKVPSEGSQSLDISSYLMINLETKERILSQNETVPRPPASTLKLLTGIVAMERLDEQDKITVGDEVTEIEGSQIGLQAGDVISVEELLTAIYVQSANDAAAALAVGAYGTLEEAIERMNELAKEIGCTNSQFKTPHGLPYPEQYTTVLDLTKIATLFIKDDTLMKYVQMKQSTVDWTRANGLKLSIPVKNTNELLNVYPGDYGLKTGTTTEAGQCLVTYIKNPDGEFLLTLLGSEKRYSETIKLLDQGLSMIRTHKALENIIENPNSFTTAPGFYTP